MKPSEQSSKPLLVNDAYPEYYVPAGNSGSGHLLFYREGTVLAQAFNPNKLELSGDPVLGRAATEAVRQWKYKPYYLNGEPVEVETQISVNFKLP